MIECDDEQAKNQNKSREKSFTITSLNLQMNYITKLIIDNFNLQTNKIRLFNCFGLEIHDNYDLGHYYKSEYNSNILFFTNFGENFESKNIMRIYNIQNKLGEVNK
jgi:hypothetical protein